VDSQSVDGSQAIAEAAGAKVVQFQFNGTWPKKKNWALENLPFRHEWVFILDADEVLPPETEAEFRAIVENRSIRWTATGSTRRFMFMDRWLNTPTIRTGTCDCSGTGWAATRNLPRSTRPARQRGA